MSGQGNARPDNHPGPIHDPAETDYGDARLPDKDEYPIPTIEELIERSSLGTPGAKALRARTPPDVASSIVERATAQRCGNCGCSASTGRADCPGGIQSESADPCICHSRADMADAASIVERAVAQPAYRPPAQPPHGWEGRTPKHFDPPSKTSMPATFSSKVVGCSFSPGYPGNYRALKALAEDENQETPSIVLRHDPDNPHDNNAVQVLAVRPAGLRMLGHLPRAVAPRIAGELDAGKDWRVTGYEVLEDPRHVDKPGLSITARRFD